MAMQPDIQYVRFYTAGSAARKLELLPKKEKATLSVPHRPRAIRRKKTVICVDPVAMFATLVAVVMFVAMGIGMVQLFTVQAQNRQMDSYLSDLRAENAEGFFLEKDFYCHNLSAGIISRVAQRRKNYFIKINAGGFCGGFIYSG